MRWGRAPPASSWIPIPPRGHAMADDTDFPHLPQATVVSRRRGRLSVVWVIPILAAAVALGIAVQRILSEGPTITIVFKAAEGARPRPARARVVAAPEPTRRLDAARGLAPGASRHN